MSRCERSAMRAYALATAALWSGLTHFIPGVGALGPVTAAGCAVAYCVDAWRHRKSRV